MSTSTAKRSSAILGPIRTELLSAERVERMAGSGISSSARARQLQAEKMPRELEELTARIARLRERLRQGDPDMAADEIQGAIDRAEASKARVVLREMFGRINMRRDGAALYAEYTLKPEALWQVVGLKA